MLYIRCFISFCILFTFFFSFFIILYIKLCLPYSIGVRSAETPLPFLHILQSRECHERLNVEKYNVLDFLLWVWELPKEDAKELVAVMHHKEWGHKHPAVVPCFPCTDDAVLREFGVQQIPKSLRGSTAASAYASRHACINNLVMFLFCYRIVTVTLLNGCRFL